jgi:hypothetical protein
VGCGRSSRRSASTSTAPSPCSHRDQGTAPTDATDVDGFLPEPRSAAVKFLSFGRREGARRGKLHRAKEENRLGTSIRATATPSKSVSKSFPYFVFQNMVFANSQISMGKEKRDHL